MLRENDWEDATIIIGYRLSGNECDETSISELMKEIVSGRLKLRIPSKGEFHEKFFLVEGTENNTNFFTDVNGSANTDLLAAGISEALITTAFGLIIAVPAIVFYRYFEQKTVILMSILQANTSIFLDFLYKK